MRMKENFNLKTYIVVNIVLAVMVAAFLLFGPSLRMGESFTAGVDTGMVAGWLVFTVAGGVLLRRRKVSFDERTASIFGKASMVSFWLLVFLGSVFQLVLRSDLVTLSLSAAEAMALLCSGGLVLFLVVLLVCWKTS